MLTSGLTNDKIVRPLKLDKLHEQFAQLHIAIALLFKNLVLIQTKL